MKLKIYLRHGTALVPAELRTIEQVSIAIGMAILLTAGLSFIGAGVRMPTPERRQMVATGAQQILHGVWWVGLFPGCALVLSLLTFGLLGDAIQAHADPDPGRRR